MVAPKINKLQVALNTNSLAPPRKNSIIVDTGTTGHFWLDNDQCEQVQPASHPIHVSMPNGATEASTKIGLLQIYSFPEASRTTHILPGLSNHSLLSIPVLCDHGCAAHFRYKDVTINKDGKTRLQGTRAPSGL